MTTTKLGDSCPVPCGLGQRPRGKTSLMDSRHIWTTLAVGVLAGAVGVAAMIVGEKLEQAVIRCPNS
jgi:hypothetical protein